MLTPGNVTLENKIIINCKKEKVIYTDIVCGS